MAHRSLSLALGLVPALFLAAALQDRSHPGQGKVAAAGAVTAEGRIAVVDFLRVAATTPEFAKAMAGIKKLQEQLQADLTAREETLRELSLKMETLKPSPELEKLNLKFELMRTSLRTYDKIYNDRLTQERLRAPLDAYAKVELAIAELAKKRKLQLVIRKNTMGKSRSVLQKRDYHFKRPVLYSVPELDITEDVIKYLKAQ